MFLWTLDGESHAPKKKNPKIIHFLFQLPLWLHLYQIPGLQSLQDSIHSCTQSGCHQTFGGTARNCGCDPEMPRADKRFAIKEFMVRQKNLLIYQLYFIRTFNLFKR